MKKRVLGIMLSLTMAMTSLGGALSVSAAEESQKTITMAMSSSWENLVTFDSTSVYASQIFDLLYDRLIYTRNDGTYEPMLADSWEMNDDNTVLTFHLKKDATWQDGEPITAKDVEFTCKLIAAPSLAAARAVAFDWIKGYGESDDSLEVNAVDDYTVEFTCAQPTTLEYLMFTKLNGVYILPEHILGGMSYDEVRNSDYWQNPVGAGAAVYDSEISGERIEFTANKDFCLGAPDWDRLVIRIVPTSNLLAGLKNGEIDAVNGNSAAIPLSDWEMAQEDENLDTHAITGVAYQYMSINTQKDYLNETVRQAINMAIDRDTIINGLLKGEGEAICGPYASNHAYKDPEIQPQYDPEKAKELLDEAGWDSSRELVFSVPTGNTVREQSAVIIQQNLQAIGINTKIETADFATHMDKVRKGDYDLGLFGSAGSPEPSECVINFQPGQLNNFAQLTDDTLYNIGKKGENVFTHEERYACYDEFQKALTEIVPWVFLYAPKDLVAFNKRLGNTTVGEGDSLIVNQNVWEWTVNE